jgi:aquaporin Z
MMTIREYAAEYMGTLLLLVLGLSAVVIFFAQGSPIPGWIPNEDLRRLLTGIAFAGSATLIVYSPLGKQSGGHINPAVTLAFMRLDKITPRSALVYMAVQFAGAQTGAAIVALVWADLGDEVQLGTTVPGGHGWVPAFVAETAMVFLLVSLILRFVDTPRLQRFTPAAAGALVAFLVFVEAPISGTSLNPARTLGPAVLAQRYTDIWIYLVAPPLGALVAVALYRRRRRGVRCGKLFHADGYRCRFLDCQYTAPERRVSRRPHGGFAVGTRPAVKSSG